MIPYAQLPDYFDRVLREALSEAKLAAGPVTTWPIRPTVLSYIGVLMAIDEPDDTNPTPPDGSEPEDDVVELPEDEAVEE